MIIRHVFFSFFNLATSVVVHFDATILTRNVEETTKVNEGLDTKIKIPFTFKKVV